MADIEDNTEYLRSLQRERSRRWRTAHPEKAAASTHTWYLANREEILARSREKRAADPDRARRYSAKAKAALKAANPARYAFQCHKDSAKRRDIPFLLTFEDWWSVWDASGKWKERGLGSDQYCMARNGDAGAYEIGNVRICTGRENRAEARKGKPLSEAHRKALVEAWKKRGPVSAAQRAAMVKAWERRRQRLPPLRTTRRGLPKAQG